MNVKIEAGSGSGHGVLWRESACVYVGRYTIMACSVFLGLSLPSYHDHGMVDVMCACGVRQSCSGQKIIV